MKLEAKKKIKSEILRVRLTEHYKRKLERYAEKHEVTVTHVICEYIRRLPNSSEDENSSTS